MAYSVNWNTKVIDIPQADLEFVSGTRYRLDLNDFFDTIKALEASEEGMMHLDIINGQAPPRSVGSVPFPREVEVINGYTITFENGMYDAEIYGGNHNIADVRNQNNVSILTNISAGLIETGTSGLTASEAADLAFLRKRQTNTYITSQATSKSRLLDDDDATVIAEWDLFEDEAGTQPYRGLGVERRNKL